MLGELLACSGSIPTAKQNSLLARFKVTTSDGTSVMLGEGDLRGWSLQHRGAQLLPARYLCSDV